MDDRSRLRKRGEGTPSGEEPLASYRYLASILESMLDAVIVANPDGTIRTVNRAALELLGYSEEELIGQAVGIIFEEEEEEEEEAAFFRGTGLAQLVREGAARNVELMLLARSGERIPVMFNGSVIREEDGRLAAVVGVARDIRERKRAEEELRQYRDHLEELVEERTAELAKANEQLQQEITERVRAEEEIRQRNRELAALNAIATVVSQSLNLDEILNAALDKVLELMRLDVGGIYLADRERRKLDLVVHRDISKEFAHEIGSLSVDEKTLEAVTAEGKLGRFILSVKAAMKDRVELKRILSAMKKEGLSLAFGTPVLLQAKDEILGLMIVASRVPRQFTKAELQLLTSIGQHIAVAIQNVRLYEAVRQELAERKRAEEALARERNLLRTLMDNLPDYIYVKNVEGRFVIANVAVARQMGFSSPDEVIGKSDFDLFPHELAAQYYAAEQEIIRSGQGLHDYEGPSIDASKEEANRWVSTTKVPLRDAQGEIAGFVGLGRDITERKWAEEELRASEQRYRLLFERNLAGVYRSTLDGRILDCNESYARIFGSDSREEVLALRASELYFDAADREKFITQLQEEGVLTNSEWCLRRKDNSPVWVLENASLIEGEEGAPTFIQGTLVDITERKRAEEELIRLSNAVRMSTDSIVIGDLEAKIIDVNEATLRMYGTDDKGDLVGKNSFDLIAPEDREKAFAGMEETLERGYTEGREYHIITRDGSKIPVEMNAALMKDVDGNPIGFVSISRDITQRKRAERLLRGLNQAALAMERALTPEEIFTAVASELKKLGFSCIVFLTDESQSRLLIRYVSYEARAIKALEKLTGLKIENFSMPIETADVYRKVVQERKAAFIENVEDVTRQFLPKPLKKFTGQIVKVLKIARSIPAPLIMEDEVIGLLSVESDDLTEEDIPAITAFAHQMAAAWRKAQLMQDLERSLAEVERAREELQHTLEKLREALGGIIQTVAFTVETKDPYTGGHQRQVTQLACAIAKDMDLPDEQIEGLRMAGLIHDLGKISIPAEVLSKPGQLTEIEFGMIKMHPKSVTTY